MFRTFLLSVAFAGLITTGAGAADVVPAEPEAFDWSGFYIGIAAGYGWGDTRQFDGGGESDDEDIDGIVAGGTLGVNWQLDSFLIGLEADLSWSDIDGSFDDTDEWGCNQQTDPSFRCVTDVPWFATARLRAGLPLGNLLPYVTGGLAIAEIKSEIEGNGGGNFDGSETVLGWTAGGGLEWAFDENWSFKAEYLWIDLPKADLGEPEFEATADFSVVRGGINYRF